MTELGLHSHVAAKLPCEPGEAHSNRSRAKGLTDFLIDHDPDRLVTQETLAYIELLITHPSPPDRLRRLRAALIGASRLERPGRRLALQFRRAAAQLEMLSDLVPSHKQLLLVLLEAGLGFDDTLSARLTLVRHHLAADRRLDRCRSEPVPRVREPFRDSQLSDHVQAVCLETLRLLSEDPERPFASLSDQELEDTVLCLRIFYCHLDLGLGNDCEPVTSRCEDFDACGIAIWNLLLAEALQRRFQPKSLSVAWTKLAQVQVRLSLVPPLMPLKGKQQESVEESSATGSPGALEHVVCPQPIPGSSDRQDKEEIERHLVLQKPLPVAPMPSLGAIDDMQSALEEEFPWALAPLQTLFSELKGRAALGVQTLNLQPTLFVGAPGSGKSRLARRLTDHLGIPRLDVPLGGTSDAKVLSGTSRGWSTGRPSDLASLLAARKQASAVVVLDELDKACDDVRLDRGLQGYLLGLLEKETAVRHRDVFLKTECDFSHVIWLATANRLSTLSDVLLSRLRVLHIPQPSGEHLSVIAEHVLRDIASTWQIEREVFPRIDELPLPWHALRSARQVRVATEAAVVRWASTLQHH